MREEGRSRPAVGVVYVKCTSENLTARRGKSEITHPNMLLDGTSRGFIRCLVLSIGMTVVFTDSARPSPPDSNSASSVPISSQKSSEVRAIWVTRWDFRTESDVRKIIRSCASLGLNRVIFQVRGQADSYYRSSFEPWGEELGGPPEKDGDPGFDPLQVALDEARKEGISLHAWVNVLPGWKGTTPPKSRKHLVHVHPEWFLTDQKGNRRIFTKRGYALLNPCTPAVRVHLVLVIREIAARYPVDGILLDYVRFLHRDPARGEDVPHDALTLEIFRNETGTTPEDNPQAWDRFRLRAIDRVVEETTRAVRLQRPGCRLSVAAVRESKRARTHLFQDAESWKRRGWIDDIYPMNYEADLQEFGKNLRGWVRACGGDSIVVGMGIHLLRSAEKVRNQLGILRAAPPTERASGYCLFAYSELFDTPRSSVQDNPQPGEQKSALRSLLLEMNGKKIPQESKGKEK